jgi:hypothetical protein
MYIVALAAFVLLSCSHKEQPQPRKQGASEQVATISQDGTTFSLNAEQAARFETMSVATTKFVENLRVSARTIAAAVPDPETRRPLIIFETQDIAQMYSDFAKSKAAHARSETQLARMKELQNNNAASGKDVLDAQTEHSQVEAALRESESKLLQIGLDPHKLAMMSSGAALMMCDVPESRIGGVTMGAEAEFEFNSFPNERFHGRVTSIGNTVDTQTRTIKIPIELPSPHSKIKPGMFARVSIQERELQAISVPHDAVINADAKTFVFVKRSEQKDGNPVFERRAVTIGADNGKEFQIIAGLKNGDNVVVKNAMLLKGISFGY